MNWAIRLFLLFPVLLFSQTNFEKAEKLFIQKDYEAAKPILEKIVKETPDNLKATEYLGNIAGYSKDWDKAIVYFRKVLKAKPSEANLYYKYGGCLAMKAKESNKLKAFTMLGEIRSSFEKAVTLNPKHIEARWGLIEYYIQVPGILGGSERKAQLYADELLKISPVDGYLSKGRIDEYFERYTEAEKNYIKAIAVGGSKVTYNKLANLYKNKMNQPEKAKTILESYAKRKG